MHASTPFTSLAQRVINNYFVSSPFNRSYLERWKRVLFFDQVEFLEGGGVTERRGGEGRGGGSLTFSLTGCFDPLLRSVSIKTARLMHFHPSQLGRREVFL